MFENLEGGTVRQMNIEEYQVGHRIGTEPVDTFCNTIQHGHNPDMRGRLRKQSRQIADGRFFIFYDKCIHINGIVTINVLFSSRTSISSLKSRL